MSRHAVFAGLGGAAILVVALAAREREPDGVDRLER